MLCLQADLDAQVVHGSDATAGTGWLAQTVGSRRSAVAVGKSPYYYYYYY